MKEKIIHFFKLFGTKRVQFKITAFILTLAIVFLAVPSVVYAETAEAIKNAVSHSEPSENASSGAGSYNIVYEDESRREESAKHFRLSDGSYIAAQYNYPVHYVGEDGEYEDIDNALKSSGGVYANSNARIKFSKKINGSEELFTLHDGNKKIALSLVGAQKGTKGKITNFSDAEGESELQKLINLERLSASVLYEDILDGVDLEYVAHSLNVKENIIVKEKSDSYTYSFTLSLNNLVAVLDESGDVYLTDYAGKTEYVIPAPVVFDANEEYAPQGAATYTLENHKNGKYTLTVSVSDAWMNDEVRAYPVTVDPAIVTATSVVKDTYVSSLAPDTNYAASQYLFVRSYATAYIKFETLPTLPATAYVVNVKLNATLGFAFNEYLAVHRVTSAWTDTTLTYNRVQNSPKEGKLHAKAEDYVTVINSGRYSWNITELFNSWKSGSYSNYGVALTYISGLTADVRINSAENSNEATAPALTVEYRDLKGAESYFTANSVDAGSAGSATVNYANGQLTLAVPTLSTTDALMPYTPTLVYNSAVANKAYTVANAEIANTNNHTGYGFKLNIYETVVSKSFVTTPSGTQKTVYIYNDVDGTAHSFVKKADVAATETTEAYTLYVDEDGLQKYMLVFSSRIELYDDTRMTRSFTKLATNPTGTTGGWYLTSIKDQNGNAVSFTYDTKYRPTKVSLTPVGSSKIEMLTLSYYSTGKLMMVQNTVSNDAVIFRYASTYSGTANTTSQNYLIEVVRAKGDSTVTSAKWKSFATSSSASSGITVVSEAELTYNSNGQISRIVNSPSGRILSYSWSSGKVTGISESAHSTATLGQSISISYGVGYTDVTSSGTDDIPNNDDDTVTRYVLDSYGRCVSTYTFHKGGSEIYGASFGSYESQEEVKNNLKEQYSLGGSVVNYLLNGSFDKAGSSSRVFANWYNSGAVSRGAAEIGRELDYYAAFAPTNGNSASISQHLTLAPGDYTLSFLYTVGNEDGILGTASLKASDSQAYNQSEIIMLNEAPAQVVIGSDSTAMSFSATFTVPQSGNYELEIRFAADGSVTSSPNIRVYKVMLENSIGASAYTLVSYGGFEVSGRESSSQVPLSQYWSNQSGSAPTVVESEAPFGKSVKVDVASTESVVSEAYVKQRVYDLSSVMTNTNRLDYIDYVAKKYIVSGFGKATDATISADSAFEIRVDVIYSMGSGSSDITVSHHFPFVSTCRGWQFVSGSFETIDQTNDLICVKAIDIYLVYSGQPNSGYALFDNISLVSADSTDLVEYEYYTEGDAVGLLKQKETFFYTEYYEYEGRNLTRIADDSGNLTDNVYDDCDRVIESYTGTFLYNSGHMYPINGANENHPFVITYETCTKYVYDSYGLNYEGLCGRNVASAKLSKVYLPTSTIYGGDCGYGNDPRRAIGEGQASIKTDANGQFFGLHSDKANLLMADAHVENNVNCKLESGHSVPSVYAYTGKFGSAYGYADGSSWFPAVRVLSIFVRWSGL